MRTISLLTTLLVIMTLYTQAQYNGRCGNFRYTIKGKLVSTVEINDVTTKTYYSIEQKSGYIWFWKEIFEPGNQQVNEFISMWARLSEIDTSCIESVAVDPFTLKVRLSQKETFFFTTTYLQKKNGPTYGVRNNLLISFRNEGTANNFSNELKQQIPIYKY
ncbi:hypothetical protein [Sediminibacterium sp. KACHI17]